MEVNDKVSEFNITGTSEIELQHVKDLDKPRNKFRETLFLSSVTGISAMIAFGSTLALARKKDPTFFNKGLVSSKALPETGVDLALRALGYGSLYAVSGCGLLFYGIWKLSGANDMQEFRMKMGSILPRISRNDPPQGRTEFEGFRDLINYISTDYSSSSSEK
ncbi:transmembrane protein 242 [Lycorma delicatula]|uniref:transmembrane protein 242 n=1 Tax=Lycorma delicatula TaxID=130591 RepID=UPI003F50F72C